jgi:hypothetical protein
MLHLQDCPSLLHPTHPQHAQALRTDVCRRPTAGHGAGAARRPGAQQPAPAHQAEARCDTPPLRSPVHAQRAAPATPSSTPARGAPFCTLCHCRWRDKRIEFQIASIENTGFRHVSILPEVSAKIKSTFAGRASETLWELRSIRSNIYEIDYFKPLSLATFLPESACKRSVNIEH